MVCWDVAWICYVCVWHHSRKWYVIMFNILCAIDDEISETNFFWQKGNQAGQCQIWQFIWTLLTLLSCFFFNFCWDTYRQPSYMHLNLVNSRQKPYSTWVFSTELVDQRKDEVRVEALPVFLHSQVSLDGWLAGFCRIILTLLYPIYHNLGFVGSTS